MQALTSMQTAGFEVEGLIHIGANDGQERHEYLANRIDPCIYVEPIDAVFANLQRHINNMPGHQAVHAVCSDADGEEIEFNIASNGGLSSSMLDLGAHQDFHPSIIYTSTQRMKTTTVDKIIDELHLSRNPNLMIIDTQGAELKVLKGSKNFLEFVDGIFVEVSEEPLYDGGCTHKEITSYLTDFGFRLRWMSLNFHGHGDAFYCRSRLDMDKHLPFYDGNIALNKFAEQSSVSHWSKENDAAGGVNGRKNGGFGFHTDFEVSPWWQVDLGVSHVLSEIRIYNRIDAVRERARTIRVLLSDDKRHWTEIHDQRGQTFGGVDGHPLRILCSAVSARYIRLQLRDQNYLHLDEIEIY